MDLLRSSRNGRAGGLTGTEIAVILGSIGIGGGALLLVAADSHKGTGPNPSVSYASTPPPACPPCGLYRTPDGRVYVVDNEGVTHWIVDEVAFNNCNYDHSLQHNVSYNAIAGCETGALISEDPNTCPCSFEIFPICTDVPCPG